MIKQASPIDYVLNTGIAVAVLSSSLYIFGWMYWTRYLLRLGLELSLLDMPFEKFFITSGGIVVWVVFLIPYAIFSAEDKTNTSEIMQTGTRILLYLILVFLGISLFFELPLDLISRVSLRWLLFLSIGVGVLGSALLDSKLNVVEIIAKKLLAIISSNNIEPTKWRGLLALTCIYFIFGMFMAGFIGEFNARLCMVGINCPKVQIVLAGNKEVWSDASVLLRTPSSMVVIHHPSESVRIVDSSQILYSRVLPRFS